MILRLGASYVVPVITVGNSKWESRTVNPSTSTLSVIPTEGFGLSLVTVTAVTASIDANIVSDNIKLGTTILGVTGNITPASFTTSTVNPSTVSQTIAPTSPYNGFSQVTLNAVTSAIDSDIIAGNIKSGVTILGVTGNITPASFTTSTISPSTTQKTVSPASPYNGFSQVTLQAVTSAIDSNIKASNIMTGITILGVTGNVSFQTYYSGSTAPSAGLGVEGDIYLQY